MHRTRLRTRLNCIHIPLLSALITIIVLIIFLLYVLVIYNKNSIEAESAPLACVYILNNDRLKLLNTDECKYDKNITIYNITLYNRIFKIEDALLTYKAMLITPFYDPVFANITRTIFLSNNITLIPKPSSIFIYNKDNNTYMLLLYSNDSNYIVQKVIMATRIADSLNHTALLIPGDISGSPIIYGIMLAERVNPPRYNITGPGIIHYNRSIDVIVVGFLYGCRNNDVKLGISIRALSGGIIAEYQPSTSYSPLTLELGGGTSLTANFSGLYLDRSDFSQETASWVIKLNRCRRGAMYMIQVLVSIGETGESVRVLIELGNGHQITIIIETQ